MKKTSLFDQKRTFSTLNVNIEDATALAYLVDTGQLTKPDFLVWCGLREMLERRLVCGAKESYYDKPELLKLFGRSKDDERYKKRLSGSIKRLESFGIISFSHEFIRFFSWETWKASTEGVRDRFDAIRAKGAKYAVLPRHIFRQFPQMTYAQAVTMIGHCYRGIFVRKDGSYKTKGGCSYELLSNWWGLGISSIQRARKYLVEAGYLVLRNVAHRVGQWFEVVLERPKVPKSTGVQKPKVPKSTGPINSTPLPKGKDINTSTPAAQGSKTKAAKAAGSGVSLLKRRKKRPTLKNVVPQDLSQTDRLMELFDQAVKLHLCRDCEANRIDFIAFAERALDQSTNPPALFMWLIRNWQVDRVTMDYEHEASRRWKAHKYPAPKTQSKQEHLSSGVTTQPKDEQGFSQEDKDVQTALMVYQHGKKSRGFAHQYLAKAGWPSERIERALEQAIASSRFA